MSDLTTISKRELARLEERTKKLGRDKAYLQLVIRLMNRVSEASGVENTVDCMLGNIADVIGGTNIILYYWLDGKIFIADVLGRRAQVQSIDDESVEKVILAGKPLEIESPFSDTKMTTPELANSYTWVYPLLVGGELVGVFKMENMALSVRELYLELPTFFSFAALALKNEMLGYSKLKNAYDRLQAANQELTREMAERRRIENSLLVTQFAVDHASDSLFWITPDARFANVNESACRRLGYGREELLKMTVFDVDPAFPKEAWPEHWREIRAKKSLTIETKHRTKSGEVFPVEVTLNYVEYEGAEYNFAFARDITERKKAEEALLRANEELEAAVADRTSELETTLERLRIELEERRRIEEKLMLTQFSVDSSADAVFWVRPDGSFGYVNGAACELFGYSSAEFQTIKTFDMNPAPAGEFWKKHWLELKRSGFLRFESTLRRKDGSDVEVEITANYLEYGGQEYNCAFVRDITDRKKAEEALQESERFLNSVVENIPDMIFVKEAETLQFVRFNNAGEQLLGYSREALLGKNDHDLFPKEEADFFTTKDREVLAAKALVDIPEEAILTGEKGERILHTKKIPILDKDGIPRYLLGISEDITERKLTEEKLARETEGNRVIAELSRAVLAAESIEDIARKTLGIAQLITESRFGYVGYIDKDTGHLICPTMTHDIWDLCGVADKSIVFEKFGGLWGWVLDNKKPLLTNDPSKDVRSSGTPPGHIPIESFLSVPAFYGDVMVGQIALANSARPYSDEDLDLMDRMATIFALGVRRKFAENELSAMNEKLDQKVKERTEELQKKIAEIERMNKLFVGRELRMVELKNRIAELEGSLKK